MEKVEQVKFVDIDSIGTKEDRAIAQFVTDMLEVTSANIAVYKNEFDAQELLNIWSSSSMAYLANTIDMQLKILKCKEDQRDFIDYNCKAFEAYIKALMKNHGFDGSAQH